VKILVTGRFGQVSSALFHRCSKRADLELFMVGRPELELSEPKNVAKIIAGYEPDIVVSAAAWTAVDMAEDSPVMAMRANSDSAREVARGAAMAGAPVIHLSTDYVYDGTKSTAWTEDDPTNPLSVYGRTKLAGERNVIKTNPKHIILRTSWVYSPFGQNFVKTMLKLAEAKINLDIVDDQYGCPTSAFDIADGILSIVKKHSLKTACNTNIWGIYHLAGTGTATWCDFAREIFRQSQKLDLPSAQVRAVGSEAFTTKAVRPTNSRLNCEKMENIFGFRCPAWFLSLDDCLQHISIDDS
jgi:dTDP-4-dehydrorhamnose reductase